MFALNLDVQQISLVRQVLQNHRATLLSQLTLAKARRHEMAEMNTNMDLLMVENLLARITSLTGQAESEQIEEPVFLKRAAPRFSVSSSIQDVE